MNILFTGSTVKQCDNNANKRAKINRIDDSTILCNSLLKSGHNLERRHISWGDDLSKYDLAIIGLGAFGSSNYHYIMNAIYVISNVKNVIIFHEDWKIESTMQSFRRALKEDTFEKMSKKQWSNGTRFYTGTDSEFFDFNKVRDNIQRVVNGEFNCLIPGFNWGDKNIISDILNITKEKLNYIDLTPYVLKDSEILKRDNIDYSTRSKKYMLASLVDHSSWVKKQGFTIPVDYYGCNKLKSKVLDNEIDVFNTMYNYWGILSPKYPQSGSGWFRIRYIYSAFNKNILIMDKKDSEALGIRHIDKIEDLKTLREVVDYSEEQSKAILSHITTIDEFDNKLNSIVEKINE